MEFLLDLFFGVIRWIVLFPVVWIMSAPVVLIASLFDKKPYIGAVRSRFRSVMKVWADWGIVIIP
jgi:hypothetical protein